VHRMGQSRGVQVINLIGQGSIEEGMLSVLAFKASLFAGVLDGGQSEIFLQGTKLSKFMESVEHVAGAMGEAEVDAEQAGSAAARAGPLEPVVGVAAGPLGQAGRADEAAPEPLPTKAADPWAAILEAGAALLQGIAATRAAGGVPYAIERDPATGQASVRLPLPEPAMLKQLAKAFEPWLK
jgi:hypothetical protein